MLNTDEEALICDFAETYRIYNYKEIPCKMAAIYAKGLKENARIKMKLAGVKVTLEDMLLASIADHTKLLTWMQTEDARKGKNRPKTILPRLLGEEERKIISFETGEEFEKEWKRLTEKRGEIVGKTELAKAYVQIIPSAKGIGGMPQNEVGGETDAAGKSLGGRIGGAIKVAVIAAGIGKAISASISEGAELEQSIGGIETLFKDSAEKVKQNAANAYKTAGMSANEYMQLTTSFSASLLQSLGNDTAKAADVADMAMTDMSDNMNKMGSNMEDIKNAYQGFAKQNYTMLDNLKLGYGGTKTEMERRLRMRKKLQE